MIIYIVGVHCQALIFGIINGCMYSHAQYRFYKVYGSSCKSNIVLSVYIIMHGGLYIISGIPKAYKILLQ